MRERERKRRRGRRRRNETKVYKHDFISLLPITDSSSDRNHKKTGSPRFHCVICDNCNMAHSRLFTQCATNPRWHGRELCKRTDTKRISTRTRRQNLGRVMAFRNRHYFSGDVSAEIDACLRVPSHECTVQLG